MERVARIAGRRDLPAPLIGQSFSYFHPGRFERVFGLFSVPAPPFRPVASGGVFCSTHPPEHQTLPGYHCLDAAGEDLGEPTELDAPGRNVR